MRKKTDRKRSSERVTYLPNNREKTLPLDRRVQICLFLFASKMTRTSYSIIMGYQTECLSQKKLVKIPKILIVIISKYTSSFCTRNFHKPINNLHFMSP